MLEIEPKEADQVTATFEVLITRAVNCWVPADATVVVAGETVTCTAGGLLDEFEFEVEKPEQAARKRSEDTKVIRPLQRSSSA